VLAAAGCTMPEGHYDGPIHERFPVPEQASTACISAAKLASKWCPPIDKDSYADMVYGTRCNEARWDYARYCR
jgi:hypothetical protein